MFPSLLSFLEISVSEWLPELLPAIVPDTLLGLCTVWELGLATFCAAPPPPGTLTSTLGGLGLLEDDEVAREEECDDAPCGPVFLESVGFEVLRLWSLLSWDVELSLDELGSALCVWVFLFA